MVKVLIAGFKRSCSKLMLPITLQESNPNFSFSSGVFLSCAWSHFALLYAKLHRSSMSVPLLDIWKLNVILNQPYLEIRLYHIFHHIVWNHRQGQCMINLHPTKYCWKQKYCCPVERTTEKILWVYSVAGSIPAMLCVLNNGMHFFKVY